MAVKFLKAFGVHVTVISTSPGKREEALKELGADAFLVSKEPESMQVGESKYGLCAVRGSHALNRFSSALAAGGGWQFGRHPGHSARNARPGAADDAHAAGCNAGVCGPGAAAAILAQQVTHLQ
jgi:D-arabinose 1-dehydrogenase-like Zn-dependent alcohol dehydrogenase